MADKIGVAQVIKGTVSASGSGGDRALEVGAPVFKGDTLIAAKSSAGSIQFLDKTVLNVGEGSKVSLDQYVYDAGKGSGQVLFKMAQGTFRAVTGEIVKHSPESFKLQSPLATIGIRGTETAHTIPAPGLGNEHHLVMVFDGKPVIIQPLGGGALQVLSQSGIKVEVGRFGSGPVLVMTPQEFKYFQALTAKTLQQEGAPTDTLTPAAQQSHLGKAAAKLQALQEAAAKAQADAQAKAAAAEALAKAAAAAAGSGADADTKAAAAAAAKAASAAAAQAAQEAKAAAELAAKAAHAFDAEQKALTLAEAVKLASQPGDQQAKLHLFDHLDSQDNAGTFFTLGHSDHGGPGSQHGGMQVYLSPLAAEQVEQKSESETLVSTEEAAPQPTHLDLSAVAGDGSGFYVDLDAPATGLVAPRNTDYYETNTNHGLAPGGAAGVTQVSSSVVNVTGGGDADKIYGDASANTIKSGQGNDHVEGKGGNDTIEGALGDDTLRGDAGNDTIDGGPGDDTMDGGADTDTLTYASAGAGVSVGLGTAGPQVTGGAGTDTISNFENLIGSDFNDTLGGTAGDNVLDGGAGTDTLTYLSAGAGITMSLALATAQATGGAGSDTIANFENLNGSNFADTLTGSSGDNVINGLDGDDTIEGGAGNDTLDGGIGIDTLSYANAGSSVTVSLAVATPQVTGGAGTDTVSTFENLTGSGFADTLTGTAGNNTINGGDGGDTITSLAGNDTINAGSGDDTVNMSTMDLNDTVHGGAGNDTLKFTDTGAVASDLNNVDGFEHIVLGNATTTVKILASLFTDVSRPSGPASGDAAIYVDGSALTGANCLTFDGSLSANGYLYITGSAQGDTLIGTGNSSTNNWGDRLYGAGAADTLKGGSGADYFVYKAPGEGGDTIQDFSRVQLDKFAFLKASAGGGFTYETTAQAQAHVYDSAAAAAADANACWYRVGDELKFDADGSGPGAVVILATVTGLSGIGLQPADVVIVGSVVP